MKICSVEGCERIIKAKGLCDMHLQHTYRNGNVGGAERTKARISSKSGIFFSGEFVYKKCNPTGCEENGIGFCEKHLNVFKNGFR
jgi:hypothetical protein